MQTSDEKKTGTYYARIVSFLLNLLRRLLSQLNVFSVAAGLIIGYLLSRPREYSYIQTIDDLKLQNRRKQDDLQLIVQRLKQEIEVSREAAAHNAKIVEA